MPARASILAAVGVSLAALMASGCGSSSQSVKTVEYGVRLSARTFPREAIRVRRARPAALPARHVLRLSPTYRLTHIERLPSTMTIRFPLAHRLPKGYALEGATRESNRRWVPLLVTASANGRYATVHVSRLSDFIFFGVNVTQLLRDIKSGVIDGLLGGVTSEASPPRCSSESQARGSGFSITSTSGTTVYWCFGVENGHRDLRVVNNRRYTLDIAHPGLSIISAGGFHLSLASLARLGAGNKTVLAPRDEAIFGADLAPGHTGGISTDYDGLAQSLFQLQFGVETAIGVLTKLGAAGRATSLTALQTFLKAKDCASAVGGSAGDIIAKCFTPSQIIQAFGFKGLLIAPLMVAGPFLDFFRTEFNSIGDQLNGRTQYRLLIRHAAPQTPAPAPATTTAIAPTTEAAPPTTTTPAAGGYAIGTPFDDECVVAWPTAPEVTSSSIEMTMTCAHVPESEFLFTHVSYGDPNLNVTPSTGKMHIVGKVIDVATSGYGYKELVIEATSVQFG